MNHRIKQSGLIGTAIVLVGAAFYIQHWPHGFLIISVGYLLFFVFWISLFIDIVRSKMNTGEKILWGLILFSGLVGAWLYYLLVLKKKGKSGRMERWN